MMNNSRCYMNKHTTDLSTSQATNTIMHNYIDNVHYYLDLYEDCYEDCYDDCYYDDHNVNNEEIHSTSLPRDDTSLIEHNSLESIETAEVVSGKDHYSVDGALMSEIDKTMKKYTDSLLHALEGVYERLSQLECRTRRLENSMDDLTIAIGNNYGSSDGKMRQLENLLREVQTDVHLMKDEQDIMEAQFLLAKLQVSKDEQQPVKYNTVNMDNMHHATASAPPGSYFAQPGHVQETESQQYQIQYQVNRPGPGVSGGYGSLSASGDPYAYNNSPFQYGNGSPVKSSQHSVPPMGQAPGKGYSQASLTASSAGSGSGSSGTTNRVPVDDVIDEVTTMECLREQVKATVRRLTENGQSVDLDTVLNELLT